MLWVSFLTIYMFDLWITRLHLYWLQCMARSPVWRSSLKLELMYVKVSIFGLFFFFVVVPKFGLFVYVINLGSCVLCVVLTISRRSPLSFHNLLRYFSGGIVWGLTKLVLYLSACLFLFVCLFFFSFFWFLLFYFILSLTRNLSCFSQFIDGFFHCFHFSFFKVF